MPLTTMPKLVADPEAGLDDEMKSRIRSHMFGSRMFDLDGRFRADEGTHRLASIHVKIASSHSPAENRALLQTERDQDLFVYLQSDRGARYPYRDCESLLGDKHTPGILFQGPDGNAWLAATEFCQHGDLVGDDPSNFPVDDVPLRRIHGQSVFCAAENGTIAEILAEGPSDGEFVITDEVNARLISIPWLSEFGMRRGAPFQPELDILDRLKERVALIAGAPAADNIVWVAGPAEEIERGKHRAGPTTDFESITRQARNGDIVIGKTPGGDVEMTWFKINRDLIRLPEGVNGPTHDTMRRITETEPHMRLVTRPAIALRLIGEEGDWTDREAAKAFRSDTMRFLQGLGDPVLEARVDNEDFTLVRAGHSVNGMPMILIDIQPDAPEYGMDMEP